MFLSFEGIDGSGKSTLARGVASHLRKTGLSVIEVREPGGTVLGEAIRILLLDPSSDITARAEVLLFSAARAHLVDTVLQPALERGDIIIADRFSDSTTAYQARARGAMSVREAEMLSAFATAGLQPDITFIVNLDSFEAAARRASVQEDRIESEGKAFQDTVRAAYLEIAAHAPERVVVLDGTLSPKELERKVLDELSRRNSTND